MCTLTSILVGRLNRRDTYNNKQRRTDTHQHVTDASVHYGKHKDPCKITYSRMAFVERGLGNKRAHANEHAKARLAGEDEQAGQQARSRLAMARA